MSSEARTGRRLRLAAPRWSHRPDADLGSDQATSGSLVVGLRRRSRLSKAANKAIERFLHIPGYYLLLRRPGTRLARIRGFELTIFPTVYDPRFYRAPAYFAEFVSGLDLRGKTVADVGTGSGLQALAAAQAGARSVVAVDINANAAAAAAINARANGLDRRVLTVASNLFSAVAPALHFDVILTNPPFCDGKARDIADRAWRAGPGYKDISPLFEQARERLKPDGVMYIILTSLSDLELVGSFVRRAGFATRIVSQRRVLLETMVIYELRRAETKLD
jgi:methylase of polypeptide subunit release factors